MTDHSQVLEIDDLYCGSFAATRTRLVGTRQNGNRTVFIFDDSQGKATEAALDFVNGPTTNLREYLSCLKELRAVAFTARKSQGISRDTNR